MRHRRLLGGGDQPGAVGREPHPPRVAVRVHVLVYAHFLRVAPIICCHIEQVPGILDRSLYRNFVKRKGKRLPVNLFVLQVIRNLIEPLGRRAVLFDQLAHFGWKLCRPETCLLCDIGIGSAEIEHAVAQQHPHSGLALRFKGGQLEGGVRLIGNRSRAGHHGKCQ